MMLHRHFEEKRAEAEKPKPVSPTKQEKPETPRSVKEGEDILSGTTERRSRKK